MTHRTPRRRAGLVAALLAVSLVAACGQDEEEGFSDVIDNESSAAPTEKPQQTVLDGEDAETE